MDTKKWLPVPVRIEILAGQEKRVLNVAVPQRIADLNEEQFIALAVWYFTPYRKEEYGYLFLQSLLALDKEDFLAIDDESMMVLLKLINPFKVNKPVSFNSLFNGFSIKKKNKPLEFTGPKNGLSNLIFDEKIFADLLLNKYLKEQSIKNLSCFNALLYRPKGVTLDDWKEREDDLNELQDQVDIKYKYAALLNYMAMRNTLPGRFPYVYRNEGGINKEPNWREITVSLAGEKLGTPDSVRRTNALDVLSLMNEMMKPKK